MDTGLFLLVPAVVKGDAPLIQIPLLLVQDRLVIRVRKEGIVMLTVIAGVGGGYALGAVRVRGDHRGARPEGRILHQRIFSGAVTLERAVGAGRKIVISADIAHIMDVAVFRGLRSHGEVFVAGVAGAELGGQLAGAGAYFHLHDARRHGERFDGQVLVHMMERHRSLEQTVSSLESLLLMSMLLS